MTEKQADKIIDLLEEIKSKLDSIESNTNGNQKIPDILDNILNNI